MAKINVFKKVKLKGQRVKVMVSNERSCQREYTCETNVMTTVKILEKKAKLQDVLSYEIHM
jgi:hypothetical protein